MADPVSIIAIAGLAYIGKKLSDPKPELYQIVSKPTEGPIIIQEEMPNIAAPDRLVSTISRNESWKENFGDIVPQTRSSGTEVLEMRNRMFDNGRMNNISPIEKQYVGRVSRLVQMSQLPVVFSKLYVSTLIMSARTVSQHYLVEVVQHATCLVDVAGRWATLPITAQKRLHFSPIVVQSSVVGLKVLMGMLFAVNT